MNGNDFHFEKMETGDGFEDYYFTVTGDTKKELTKQYMEQCMIEVNTVIYANKERSVIIQQVFPFNCNYVVSEDPEIKNMLERLVLKNEDNPNKRTVCRRDDEKKVF